MRKIKWKKILSIIVVAFLGLITILVIVFNQPLYTLIISLGSREVYYGNNERGNKMMNYGLSKIKEPNENLYHAISVQNTKNGNYNIAISALEKAYEKNPEQIGAYYGWVLLYYYHDYRKALDILNAYDETTPNSSDWPMGECIHYLKGLALMQLNKFSEATEEFDISIRNTSTENGEDWVNDAVFINKARCLLRLDNFHAATITLKKVLMYSDKCTEAYYFLAVSQIQLGQNEEACQNLIKAHELILKGYKSSDLYVELFHEIYEQEVENKILTNCTD